MRLSDLYPGDKFSIPSSKLRYKYIRRSACTGYRTIVKPIGHHHVGRDGGLPEFYNNISVIPEAK